MSKHVWVLKQDEGRMNSMHAGVSVNLGEESSTVVVTTV